MRTLEQFAESILLIFYGGELTDDAKHTLRSVAILINQERDNLIREDLWRKMDNDEGGPDAAFFKEYELDIQWDADNEISYVSLTDTVASLPHDKGIGAVYIQKDPGNAFIRLPKNTFSLIPSQKHFLEGQKMWELKDSRTLRLHNTRNGEFGTRKMIVDMIQIDADPSTSLEEPLRVPSGYEKTIRDNVLMILGYRKTPTDDTNDNRDQA